MPVEAVPDADRQEQHEPASQDPHRTHRLDPDRPEADVLEQEMPTEDDAAVDVDEVPPSADEEEDWRDQQLDR